MLFLKQSTSVSVKIGPFLDSVDGVTAEDGLTISRADVLLSKADGAFAQKTEATTCTHDAGGWYACPLDTTDTATVGRLQLSVEESGALPVWHDYFVLSANVYDALVGTDLLQTDLAAIFNTALTETGAGYLAAAFKKLFDVATPLLVASAAMRGTDGAELTGAAAAAVAGLGDVATSGDLSTLQTHGDSTWATATGFAVPGDEMDLVDAPNGTAVTAIQSGLATGTNVSDLQTHGDSTWATATGFAVPGDEMDLIDAPNATAVTAIQSGLATGTNVSDLETHGDSTWATATGFELSGAAATAVGTLNDLSASDVTAAVPTAAANAAAVFASTVDMTGATDKTFTEILDILWAFCAGKQTMTGTTNASQKFYAPDGSTATLTFTIDDASNPTTRTPA